MLRAFDRWPTSSWGALLYEADPSDLLLFSDDLRDLPGMRERRGHRAIGVVYAPDRERLGNYVPTDLVERCDALLTCQTTTALHPLHLSERSLREPPETYPYAV